MKDRPCECTRFRFHLEPSIRSDYFRIVTPEFWGTTAYPCEYHHLLAGLDDGPIGKGYGVVRDILHGLNWDGRVESERALDMLASRMGSSSAELKVDDFWSLISARIWGKVDGIPEEEVEGPRYRFGCGTAICDPSLSYRPKWRGRQVE